MSGSWRLALAVVAGALLAAAAFLLTRHQTAPPAPPLAVITAASRPAPTRQPTPRRPEVYVSGAVATPGVYMLPPSARVKDALAAAGGATADADLNHVNLAAPISDGEQIAVPHIGDPTPTPDGGRAKRGATPTPQGDWLLNVNTATVGDFKALPGIGQVTAQRIVTYRDQHGPYASLDDLLKAGVRKTELDRIRARLTVQ